MGNTVLFFIFWSEAIHMECLYSHLPLIANRVDTEKQQIFSQVKICPEENKMEKDSKRAERSGCSKKLVI